MNEDNINLQFPYSIVTTYINQIYRGKMIVLLNIIDCT
uniref:Uncharacterized protein n=1 Tax=Arundo donax TaxID=35708 RepID=A0A0A9HD42_ARUDO